MGTIGHGACSQLARVQVREFVTKNRGRREKRKEKKEVKNKVSIHKEM